MNLFRWKLKTWLRILGVSAAITLTMPGIVIILMISIIGIPLALFLAASPFLALVVAGAWWIGPLFGEGKKGRILGALAALALLAIPPFFINQGIEKRAAELVSGDRDDGSRPALRTVGVRVGRIGNAPKRPPECDDFCQRALMNGVANRVLYVYQDINDPVDPKQTAASYRMERRGDCPEVELSAGRLPLQEGGIGVTPGKKNAQELMRLEFAKGNCLIEETAPLGDAEVILSVGPIRRGKSQLGAGMSLSADTVSADRIAMHELRGEEYTETYRWTGVRSYKLAPFVIPTVVGGAELRMYTALLRTLDRKNIDDRYYQGPDWKGFLKKRLGLDLELHATEASSETRAVLKTALASTDPPLQSWHGVANDYFFDIRMRRAVTADEFALAREVLVDERFKVPSDAWAALRYVKNPAPADLDAIATTMFRRLRVLAAADDGAKNSRPPEEVGHIAGVLRDLPPEAVLKHLDDFEWLARQDRLRVSAYRALIRLSEFGAKGAKTLLWLIDDAARFKEGGRNGWQHPYLAGVLGLCETGPAGKEFIEPFLERLADGRVVSFGSYYRLNVHTLVSLGASDATIRAHLPTEEGREKSLELELTRARKEVRCYF